MTMPDPALTAVRLDSAVQLGAMTDADVDALKAALGGLIDAKLAHFRDHDADASKRASDAAAVQLEALGIGAVMLYGDLGDLLTRTRADLLIKAVQRG